MLTLEVEPSHIVPLNAILSEEPSIEKLKGQIYLLNIPTVEKNPEFHVGSGRDKKGQYLFVCIEITKDAKLDWAMVKIYHPSNEHWDRVFYSSRWNCEFLIFNGDWLFKDIL